jgi:hypothetical protein
MADGTIPIRWWAPLPVVAVEAEAAERERLRGHHLPVVLVPVALVVVALVVVEEPPLEVAVVVGAAGAEGVPQLRPQLPRIFSVPNRISCM